MFSTLSVQKFADNAGLSAIEMVDKLLDTLTNGQHSKAQQQQEEQVSSYDFDF